MAPPAASCPRIYHPCFSLFQLSLFLPCKQARPASCEGCWLPWEQMQSSWLSERTTGAPTQQTDGPIHECRMPGAGMHAAELVHVQAGWAASLCALQLAAAVLSRCALLRCACHEPTLEFVALKVHHNNKQQQQELYCTHPIHTAARQHFKRSALPPPRPPPLPAPPASGGTRPCAPASAHGCNWRCNSALCRSRRSA